MKIAEITLAGAGPEHNRVARWLAGVVLWLNAPVVVGLGYAYGAMVACVENIAGSVWRLGLAAWDVWVTVLAVLLAPWALPLWVYEWERDRRTAATRQEGGAA